MSSKHAGGAKKEPANNEFSSLDITLDTIQLQVASTKTFDNAVQRIEVLIRAADLLWPYQKSKAQEAFAEAFDLATQNYKDTGDEPRRDGTLRIQVPDQRYKVISALAKLDPAAARKISEQMLDDEAREAANKPSTDRDNLKRTAEKLLAVASRLASTDAVAAVSFAKASLRYTATFRLSVFLYELMNVNKPIADQFYEDALAAYAAAPMDQFLYLSSYPFGNNRDAGKMPTTMIYRVPEGFTPSLRLQRLFTTSLLAKIQLALAAPVEMVSGDRLSDPAQMWLALTRLEKQIHNSLPDLSDQVAEAKGRLFALLPQSSQRRVKVIIDYDDRPGRSFDEQVEAAQKLSDVGRRDQQISSAVTGASQTETVDHVVAAIDKISDSNVRGPLLNWFYFFRTQSLIHDKKLEEA